MKKIIIADSVRIFLARKKSLLDRASFEIITTSSSEEALRIHEAELADLIITNLDMPGMAGDEMCMRLRRKKEISSVSVILICPDSPESRDRASKCRANAVITEPCEPEELIETAVRLLNIPQRESFRVLISMKIEGRSRGGAFLCNLVNLSVTGMLIETSRALSRGDNVSSSFFLPGAQQISVRGSIVRVSSTKVDLHEYGIQFSALPAETKSLIGSFVSTKMKDL